MSDKGCFLSCSSTAVYAAIILYLLAGPATAQMGKKSNICGSWNNYCRGGGGGGGGGSYGGGAGAMMGLFGNMMQGIQRGMEQGRRNRNTTARRLNSQGVREYKNGNYYSAWQKFKNALRYSPHDKVIKKNLRNALTKLNRQRRAAQARSKAQLTAAKNRINRMIGNLESDLTRGAPSSTLDSVGVDFTKPGGTSFFGTGGGGDGQVAQAPTGDGSGLDFVQSSDRLFSKGTKNSAPVNLRPDASDQLASANPIGTDAAVKGQPVDQGGGLGFIAPDQTVMQETKLDMPTDLRDQVASLPENNKNKLSRDITKDVPTLKPEKGPAVLDKNTNYDAVKAGVMEWVATGKKPKLNTKIPEPVYPPKSLKAAVLLDSLEHGKGDWKKSQRYLEDLKKKKPDQPHIQAAIDDLKTAKATAHWKKVAEVNSGTKPAPPLDAKTRELIEKGRILAENGNLLKARKYYAQAYWNRTDFKAIGEKLNQIHRKLLEEAKVLQEKARKNIRAGNYSDAHDQLAAAWQRKPVDNKLREQLIAVSKNDIRNFAIAGPPVFRGEAKKHLEQGFEQRNKGQFGQALDSFSRASKEDPNSQIVRDNFFYTKGAHEARQQARGVKYLNSPVKND